MFFLPPDPVAVGMLILNFGDDIIALLIRTLGLSKMWGKM